MEKLDEKEKCLHDRQKQVGHGGDWITLKIKTFRYFIVSALTAAKVKTFYKLLLSSFFVCPMNGRILDGKLGTWEVILWPVGKAIKSWLMKQLPRAVMDQAI